MGQYINKIYEAQADGADFQNLDKLISEKADECLKGYRETLPPMDYENVRDAAFSVAAITKKQAFEIGFKAAINLILECRNR